MNCVFDCEYCYLKGMYPSANLVVFVNLEDIFAEVEKRLAAHPVYLCVLRYGSAGTRASDRLCGALDRVCAQGECRRASGCASSLEPREPEAACGRRSRPEAGVVCAFTISPQQVIDAYEHGTASLAGRLAGAKAAMEHGFSVRLCFDPMIYCSDWKNHYDAMLAQVCGTRWIWKNYRMSASEPYRISQDYLKKMRKNEPDSAVVQFPYQNDSGVYHYPTALMEESGAVYDGKTCRLSSGRADFQMEGIRREYMEQCRENKAAIVTGLPPGSGRRSVPDCAKWDMRCLASGARSAAVLRNSFRTLQAIRCFMRWSVIFWTRKKC